MDLTQPESAGFSSARLARIGSAMQRLVDEGKFAGILTLIATRDQVIHYESTGWQTIETGARMQEDTLFRIYSMTKPITSTAVMMLYEEGRFRLHDPVREFLPEFKELQVAEQGADGKYRMVPAARPVTIHDLLTHSGGLVYGGTPDDPIGQAYEEIMPPLWGGSGPNALRDFARGIARLPLHHQPGQSFYYSLSTDVLGRLVEVISGMPFGDYLKRSIFEPLKMADTAFFVPPEKASRLASMYSWVEENGAPVYGHFKNEDPLPGSSYLNPDRLQSGGGGLVSTVGDYLRFARMILNHGELDGARLLGRKTVELMRANHLPEGQYQDPELKSHGFGLGGYVLLHLERHTANGSVGNWGWGGMANTFFWVDFKEQIIPMIFIQHLPFSPLPIEDMYKNLVYQAMI